MTPSPGPIEQQYGLADFGRRVPGLGESNARRAYSAKPSKLPAPDGYWPGGRPWWWESTVDAYARSVGKPVPADARWPLAWPDATTPAPLRSLTQLSVPGSGTRTSSVSVLVYDTARAPVAYLLRHDLDTRPGDAADYAADAVPAADRPGMIVLVPDFRALGDDSPHADVEVFIASSADPAAARGPRGGTADAGEIARVLGRPLPMWLDHTCTPDAVRESVAYGDAATISAPESTTDWPAIRAALHAVVQLGIPERYPQAFALLAARSTTWLTALQQRLAATARTGDGWYLGAVPVVPTWPIELEHLVTSAAHTAFDAELAATELPGLRGREADLAIDDPAGDALHEATGLLTHRLRDSHPEIAYAAPERTAVQSAGPVTNQYLASLTRLSDDRTQALLAGPTRRLAALLTGEHTTAGWQPVALDRARARLIALYESSDGRWTADLQPYTRGDTHHLAIEWPVGLPAGFSDDTRIAADDADDGPKLVVALTPAPDGGLRTELLPNPGDDPGYSWGYEGGGPRTLYRALMRCATGHWRTPLSGAVWISHIARYPETSALYQAITQHRGQLRLQWSDIRQRALTDQTALQHLQQGRPEAGIEGGADV